MKPIVTSFLAALSLVTAAHAAHVEQASVTTADGVREFWIATPDEGLLGPHPLVLLLHGHSGSATQIINARGGVSPLAQWMAIVDREKVVAVALQGLPDAHGQRGWNDCRGDTESNAKVDDVAFASAVVGEIERRGWLDRTRLYAMGMSNGAMMTLRLAHELTPPLAAFAAASGSMASQSSCHAPSARMSALFISGTRDPLVPYEGGQVHFFARPLGGVLSIADSVDFWRRFDDLPQTGVQQEIPHLAATDATRAERTTYGADPAGLQVALVRIEGGGHYEPSLVRHPGPLYAQIVGAQNRDFESAEEAWRFFADKRQPAAAR